MADINTATVGTNLSLFTELNGALIFKASDGVTGYELYRSDGTAQGTQRLKDILPGADSGLSDLAYLPTPNTVVANGLVFFAADDGAGGNEPWVTDGTSAGTRKLKDLSSDIFGSMPHGFVELNGLAYFEATDAGQTKLWRSDGTSAGTSALGQFLGMHDLTVVGNNLFFIANGGQLWKSDGTAQMTTMVAAIPRSSPTSTYDPTALTNLDGTLYFIARPAGGNQMYTSDGTADGTRPLFATGNYAPGSGDGPIAYHGTLVFADHDAATGTELRVLDPRAGDQPRLLKDINPGSESGGADQLTLINDLLYFTAVDGVHGLQLWRTDGTEGGTIPVTIFAQTAGNHINYITRFNGAAYFRVGGLNDPIGTSGLYRSDGTADGTVRVATWPQEYYQAGAPLAVGNQLFIHGIDVAHGEELWTTDGSDAGTHLVKDINLTADSRGPGGVRALGDWVYFSATSPELGYELWKAPAAGGDPILVKDINPGPSGSSPSNLAVVGGLRYFQADDGQSGSELWRSDGTAQGTYRVKDIYPGSGYDVAQLRDRSSKPGNFIDLGNGRFFFTADDGEHGNEPWISDGTEVGTHLLADINAQNSPQLTPPPNSYLAPPRPSIQYPPVRIGDLVYFGAFDGTNYGLWKTDGTSAGTVLITNTPYIPLNLDALGSLLLFNGGSDLSLWKSDGTAAGTTMLSSVRGGTSSNQSPNGAVLGGTYYYPAGSALWKTDGTVSGTVQIKSFTSGPFGVTLFRGKLYFDASEGQSGLELWTSDGAPDGTVLFADLAANTGNDSTSGSQPDSFTVSSDNMFYFAADDHVHGRELWTTDGTPAGTRLLRDIMPGAGASAPSGLTANGDALFFVADDGVHGRELWRYAPLVVRATRFDPDTHTLTLTFSENVASPPSIGDLSVRNLANGGSVSATSVAYNAPAHTVTFTLPVLGDGDYRAVLAAGAVRDRDGSALSADVVTPLFQMAGDANHDHVVDFLDLALLAQNYNRANKTFSQGDFNYDNTVDFNDLAILAQHYLSVGTATASETIATFLSSSSNDTSKPTKTLTKTPTRTPPHSSAPVFRVVAPTPRPRAIPPKKRR